MGDHFVLLMDRLLTESTLIDALESRNQLMQTTPSTDEVEKVSDSLRKVDVEDLSTPRKVVECRICQDEDFDSNMATPCSCCGSLRYAHRACVQRWCNEKGNITCEICNQQFKPGYTAPPPLFQLRHIPMHFRGNWQISRRELNNARMITLVRTDQHFLDNPPQEEYSVLSTRNVMCFRLILLIFTVLLILRHTLPFIISGTYEYSLPLFMLLFVRTAGILLPVFFILKAVTSIQRRRLQQVQNIEVIPDRESAAGS